MQGCVLLRKEWKGPNSSRLVNNLGSPHKQEVKTKAELEKALRACPNTHSEALSKGQRTTGWEPLGKSLLTSWALMVRTSLPHPLTDAKFTKLMQETHNTKPKKGNNKKPWEGLTLMWRVATVYHLKYLVFSKNFSKNEKQTQQSLQPILEEGQMPDLTFKSSILNGNNTSRI